MELRRPVAAAAPQVPPIRCRERRAATPAGCRHAAASSGQSRRNPTAACSRFWLRCRWNCARKMMPVQHGGMTIIIPVEKVLHATGDRLGQNFLRRTAPCLRRACLPIPAASTTPGPWRCRSTRFSRSSIPRCWPAAPRRNRSRFPTKSPARLTRAARD